MSIRKLPLVYRCSVGETSSPTNLAGDDVSSSNILSSSAELGSPHSTLSESIFELGSSSLRTASYELTRVPVYFCTCCSVIVRVVHALYLK